MAECASFPEHPQDCVTINTVRRVFGALSCIGCIFVIFVIWLFNRYTSLAQRLILYLGIAALLNGIGRLFQDSTSEHGGWCSFQAMWLTYFNWAVMLWVGCITINLYMNVIWARTTETFERWYHAACWGVSLFASLLPFIKNHYGPSGSWCWITGDVGWQLAIWYVPLFIFIVFNSAIYMYIILKLRRQATAWTGTYDPENERNQQLLKEDIKALRLYPLFYALLSIFPLINRIQNATSPNQHVFALVLLHAISATVQGVVYSLVFAIDRPTLRSLTPAQIKTALQSKWASPIVVREYEVGVTHLAATSPSDNSPSHVAFENIMATATDDNYAAKSDNSVAKNDNCGQAASSISTISFVPSESIAHKSEHDARTIVLESAEQGEESNQTDDSSTA